MCIQMVFGLSLVTLGYRHSINTLMDSRQKLLHKERDDAVKTDVVITMSLTEVKDLRKSAIIAMEALREKVSQMDGGYEKDVAIHSYKKLEAFKDTITY